jgi:hypothetical protein
VTDVLPFELADVQWSCQAESGASCPAVGTGTVAATVDLPPGSRATFVVTGLVTADCPVSPCLTDGLLTNRATVEPLPEQHDPTTQDHQAIDTDVVDFGFGASPP